MRRGGRKDSNHDEIVAAFERLGCYVLDLHQVGGGMPDLFVRAKGSWYPVEIKNAAYGYGRRGLNKNQQKMNREMHDDFRIVKTVAEVEDLVAKWRLQASA